MSQAAGLRSGSRSISPCSPRFADDADSLAEWESASNTFGLPRTTGGRADAELIMRRLNGSGRQMLSQMPLSASFRALRVAQGKLRENRDGLRLGTDPEFQISDFSRSLP